MATTTETSDTTNNSKITGTVKWFSNRQGYGFIEPSSDNTPTKEDIFVHQTGLVADGPYRTLSDGYEVEFEVITDDTGKLKATNVTGPGGATLPSDAKRPRRRRRPKGDDAKDGDDDDDAAAGGDENGAEETAGSN